VELTWIRHPAKKQRREAVAELAAEGMSQRGIAEVLGVDHETVRRDLSVANATLVSVESNDGVGFIDESVANATPIDSIAALAATTEIRKGVERAEASVAFATLKSLLTVASQGREEPQVLHMAYFYIQRSSGFPNPGLQ